MWSRDGGTRVQERRRENADALPCRNRERLGALLQDLEPRLTAVALRFTRDPESARDVVQNAFEKVVRHCESFRGGSKPSTWMHRIVANEALMWLRSERRRAERSVALEEGDEVAIPDPMPDAPELLERARVGERVRRGLQALRPEERQVLERCTLDGRSYAQLSRETGVRPEALKSRAFRARRRLGEILMED